MERRRKNSKSEKGKRTRRNTDREEEGREERLQELVQEDTQAQEGASAAEVSPSSLQLPDSFERSESSGVSLELRSDPSEYYDRRRCKSAEIPPKSEEEFSPGQTKAHSDEVPGQSRTKKKNKRRSQSKKDLLENPYQQFYVDSSENTSKAVSPFPEFQLASPESPFPGEVLSPYEELPEEPAAGFSSAEVLSPHAEQEGAVAVLPPEMFSSESEHHHDNLPSCLGSDEGGATARVEEEQVMVQYPEQVMIQYPDQVMIQYPDQVMVQYPDQIIQYPDQIIQYPDQIIQYPDQSLPEDLSTFDSHHRDLNAEQLAERFAERLIDGDPNHHSSSHSSFDDPRFAQSPGIRAPLPTPEESPSRRLAAILNQPPQNQNQDLSPLEENYSPIIPTNPPMGRRAQLSLGGAPCSFAARSAVDRPTGLSINRIMDESSSSSSLSCSTDSSTSGSMSFPHLEALLAEKRKSKLGQQGTSGNGSAPGTSAGTLNAPGTSGNRSAPAPVRIQSNAINIFIVMVRQRFEILQPETYWNILNSFNTIVASSHRETAEAELLSYIENENHILEAYRAIQESDMQNPQVLQQINELLRLLNEMWKGVSDGKGKKKTAKKKDHPDDDEDHIGQGCRS